MKFFKRIITLMLAVTMICGVTAFADTGIYGLSGEYADRISLVSYLGIADSIAQSEAKTATVLRGEFAIYVAKILNLSVGNEPTERYFTDVANDHWAVGEINELVKMNIISVSEDKLFRPDDAITETEALKMVLSACGYGDWANVNGGYPYGYTKASKMADMSDYSKDAPITYEKTIDLLYEGLTVPLYDMTSFGDKVSYEASNENALSLYHKFYTGEGTVTYANGISIDGQGSIDDGYIRIDGARYKTDISMLSYIGQTKSFVYKKNNNDDNNKEIVLVNSKNANDKILKISKEDFAGYSADEGTVSYYLNDKLTTAKLSNSAVAVKNGKEYRNNTAEAFELNKGDITLISTDGSNTYNYAIVFDYKNFVVDRIDSMNEIVYDRTSFANSLKLDSNTNAKKVIIEKGGKRVDFGSIAVGDVITAYESDVFVRAIVTSNQVIGTLYNIKNDKDGSYLLKIGKVESDASDYAIDKDYFAGSVKDTISLPLSASATYYMDAFGKIAYIEYGTGLPWQFAYIMDYSTNRIFETKVTLKLILQTGTQGAFDVSDKVKIDGETVKDGNKVLSYLAKEERFGKSLSEGEDSIKGQLIRIKVDTDNEISEIDTEYVDSSSEGSQSLKRTDKLQSLYYRYHPQSFNGKFLKNGNTICFIVPDYKDMDGANDADFKVIPASSSYFWNKTHKVEGFKLDQSGGAEDAIVIYANFTTTTMKSGYYLVDTVSDSITANGTRCKKLHLWASGVEYDYTCDEDYDLSVEVTEGGTTKKYTVEEGDIIKIGTDFNENVVNAQIIYDYSRRNESGYSATMGFYGGDYYTDQGNMCYMYIKSIKDNVVALTTTKPTEDEYITSPQKADYVTTFSGNTIMIYDENAPKNKIYKGSLSDLVPADKTGENSKPYFLLTNRGLVIGAIIYR